jgi:hypothetical protein
MSVNDDLKKAQEERDARLKNPSKLYGPTSTQLTPEEWASLIEETKTKKEKEKNKLPIPSRGQMGADQVKRQKYEAALEAVRAAKTDEEAAAAIIIARELAPVGGTNTQGPNVADGADEQAKLDYLNNSITATPDDALNQRRWKNSFAPGEIPSDPDAIIYKDPKLGTSDPNSLVPISFMANRSGNIYQSKDGRPESRDSAVSRIANEYQNSGKLNELRDLFIANKFVTDPALVKYLQAMKEASPNYADQGTREIIRTAINYTSRLNGSIANADTYGKRTFSTFEDFIKSYKGQFNIDNTKNSSGYQSPRYEKNVSINNFDANDIEIAVDQMFQKYTGQGADASTAKLIADKLNSMTPQTTEIRRKGDNSVTTVTGGVTAGDQALAMREQALADPQAENYNKATTFLNYFRDALKAPIQLG